MNTLKKQMSEGFCFACSYVVFFWGGDCILFLFFWILIIILLKARCFLKISSISGGKEASLR